MADIEEIRRIATEVRTAMDTLIIENKIPQWCTPFKYFPNICCGDMSIILSTHFINLGFDHPDYICGKHYDDDNINSHAWIRLNGICIDITADQFSAEQYDRVIVEYEKDYPLLNKFHPDREETSKYTIDTDILRKTYSLIQEQLEKT